MMGMSEKCGNHHLSSILWSSNWKNEQNGRFQLPKAAKKNVLFWKTCFLLDCVFGFFVSNASWHLQSALVLRWSAEASAEANISYEAFDFLAPGHVRFNSVNGTWLELRDYQARKSPMCFGRLKVCHGDRSIHRIWHHMPIPKLLERALAPLIRQCASRSLVLNSSREITRECRTWAMCTAGRSPSRRPLKLNWARLWRVTHCRIIDPRKYSWVLYQSYKLWRGFWSLKTECKYCETSLDSLATRIIILQFDSTTPSSQIGHWVPGWRPSWSGAELGAMEPGNWRVQEISNETSNILGYPRHFSISRWLCHLESIPWFPRKVN